MVQEERDMRTRAVKGRLTERNKREKSVSVPAAHQPRLLTSC